VEVGSVSSANGIRNAQQAVRQIVASDGVLIVVVGPQRGYHGAKLAYRALQHAPTI